MKIAFSLLLIGFLSLTSCKKELEPQESSEAAVVLPTQPDASAVAPAVQTQQVQPGSMATTTTTTAQPPAPPTTARGMNPPHGQPGHRCDIPVGAPLNSPAKTNPNPNGVPSQVTPATAAPVQMTPAVISSNGTVTPGANTKITTTTTNNSSTPALLAAPVAAGMNPAHGQPGHRCDVAVGAALPK